MFLCSIRVFRFFKLLRSVMWVMLLPDKSRCSRCTFWWRFSIVLMLLLAKLSQVRRLMSLSPSIVTMLLWDRSRTFKW